MEEKSMEAAKSFVKIWDECSIESVFQSYVIVRLSNRSTGLSKLVHVHFISKQQTADGISLVFKLAGKVVCATVMSDGRVFVNNQEQKQYGFGEIQKTIIPAKTTLCSQESFIPSQRTKLDDEPMLTSPLAGRVLTVGVVVGQSVKKNQPVLTVESMKMENEICAPYDAIIKTLLIKPGDLVQPNQRLITFFLGEGVSNATPAYEHEQKEVSHR